MKIGICSGYFQRFHSGHKDYIFTALKRFDCVIVIVNNDKQQHEKYKDFEHIKSVQEICSDILKQFPDVKIKISEDADGSVCKSLESIRKEHPFDRLYFCKDGDRNKKNIPEIAALKANKIRFKQFRNHKLGSSSYIMALEAGKYGRLPV